MRLLAETLVALAALAPPVSSQTWAGRFDGSTNGGVLDAAMRSDGSIAVLHRNGFDARLSLLDASGSPLERGRVMRFGAGIALTSADDVAIAGASASVLGARLVELVRPLRAAGGSPVEGAPGGGVRAVAEGQLRYVVECVPADGVPAHAQSPEATRTSARRAALLAYDRSIHTRAALDLAERFGQSYTDYQAAVRCWVPRVHGYTPNPSDHSSSD